MQNFLRFNQLLFLLLLAFSLVSGSSCSAKEKDNKPVNQTTYDTLYTYTNPVGNITNIGDPYILRVGSKYYLYATSSDRGFKVWNSDNMVDWTEHDLALNRDYPGNIWGKGNFWAPEVKYLNGVYYMTYSAVGDNDLMKIRIATSKDPDGPFVNYSEPFLNNDNFSYIDGSLLIDGDQIYLYYVRDCSVNIIGGKHISQIFVSRLSSDLKTLETEPLLAIYPSQGWEGAGNDWQWNEGPAVIKRNGLYYLLYSANLYSSADYSVGCATSSSPLGPWVKYENPVLKKNPSLRVSGPGHCNVTTSPDSSELFMVYHTHTNYDAPSGDRNVCIDRMVFTGDVLSVNGPTRTPQPLPLGDAPRIIKRK